MREFHTEQVVGYLKANHWISPTVQPEVTLLDWGVSNVVFRISAPGIPDLVIKQSRRQLRTEANWESRPERIFRETEIQCVLSDLLPFGTVPRVLFEDRENFLYGMQAIEADHVVWKGALLAGDANASLAVQTADILAAIHAPTAGSRDLQQRFSDVGVFDELRLDPFYRYVADRFPDLRKPLSDLIHETLQTSLSLVLGDFSPKNILLTSSGVSLVDFETGHFGDPAFDVGFFLSHLLLKTILHAGRHDRFLDLAVTFWQRYRQQLQRTHRGKLPVGAMGSRSVRHLAACLRARIDGKSPVDYLDDRQRDFVRGFSSRLFAAMPARPEEAFRRLQADLEEAPPA